MKNKRGFEFSFAWLFGIIVGAVILFLAVYFSYQLIDTSRYQVNTITAKQLSIIFEPLETGLASGKSNFISLNEETRIYNSCNNIGEFGKNLISLSEKSGFENKWGKPGGEISLPNKYIFSQDIEQGKEVCLLSKPFEFPWKVSEMIILTTKSYCFIHAPDFIVNEITGLGLKNINIYNCSIDDVRICFSSSSDCDIRVVGSCINNCGENEEYDYGVVRKNDEELYYTGNLLYSAIFSSKNIYECNVKRLMKRAVLQGEIFLQEADFLFGKCNSNTLKLVQLVNSAKGFSNSEDLIFLYDTAVDVGYERDNSQCPLWS